MRPLVGITGYVETVHSGDWDRQVTFLPQSYVNAVHAAGGRAVVLPPAMDGIDRVIAALDGLILAGGPDLDPGVYGAEREPATAEPRPDRDAGESALLAAATAADLPVLGICRGMQLMVACAGGSLHQHLPDIIGHIRHQAAVGVHSPHPVRTVGGSRLAGLIGPHATVPSYHHQGIADAGGLTVSAYADDGTVEAVERPAARF
ncbi:MAG: putative glutamine amidotransferase, partial [Mycobacteriales bacterium]